MALHALEHVLVLTDDLEATRAFYCDVLGLEAGDRPELPFPGYWLYLDGVPCVHVAERAAYEAQVDRMGLRRADGPVDHLAFAAADHDELAAAPRRRGHPGGLERRARRGHQAALLRRPERHPDRAERPVTDRQAVAAVAARGAFPRIRSEAFSAIMIVAAFVFARVIVGITDASTTRSPSTP